MTCVKKYKIVTSGRWKLYNRGNILNIVLDTQLEMDLIYQNDFFPTTLSSDFARILAIWKFMYLYCSVMYCAWKCLVTYLTLWLTVGQEGLLGHPCRQPPEPSGSELPQHTGGDGRGER